MPRKSCATSWQHFKNEPQRLGEPSRHIETRMVPTSHRTRLFAGWLGGASTRVFFLFYCSFIIFSSLQPPCFVSLSLARLASALFLLPCIYTLSR